MTRGGDNTADRVNSLIITIGALIPLALAVYFALIQANLVNVNRLFSQTAVWVILAGWAILGLHRLLYPKTNRLGLIIHLVFYHILAASYLLLVTGVSSPLTFLWSLLPVAAFAYFGKNGYTASMLFFLFIGLTDIAVYYGTIQSLISAIASLLAIATIGTFMTILTQELERDRQRLVQEQAEERFQRDRVTTIINNLTDAIIATDAKGRIDTFNAASLSLLDTNQSLDGKSIGQALKLTHQDGATFSLTAALKSAKSVVARDDLMLEVGEEKLNVSLVFSPIRSTDSSESKKASSHIIILRDITRQKSLEEERDEFISVVSHELRTPITIAEGTLSNLQVMHERGGATASQLNDGIGTAHQQIIFLADMINNLSTLSRAERGVMADRVPIAVEPFIHNIYRQYSKEAEKKKLLFNLDIDPQLGTVEASELYLGELIQNFITNAIKYTKTGSVTLGVHKKDDTLRFFVKDTGIGVSKGDQKKIFEKFFRSEDYRTRETSGTGLGLHVAKKLANLLGTEIELESRLNYGSTFSFELPQSKD